MFIWSQLTEKVQKCSSWKAEWCCKCINKRHLDKRTWSEEIWPIIVPVCWRPVNSKNVVCASALIPCSLLPLPRPGCVLRRSSELRSMQNFYRMYSDKGDRQVVSGFSQLQVSSLASSLCTHMQMAHLSPCTNRLHPQGAKPKKRHSLFNQSSYRHFNKLVQYKIWACI